MDNSKMFAGRILAMYRRRKLFRFITDHLKAGNEVHLCTTQSRTVYKLKHLDLFKLYKSGVHLQQGKREVCVNFSTFEVYSPYGNRIDVHFFGK